MLCDQVSSTTGAHAITHASVELCSAPCKVLGYAPTPRLAGPSDLDGASAQLVRTCSYVMARNASSWSMGIRYTESGPAEDVEYAQADCHSAAGIRRTQ